MPYKDPEKARACAKMIAQRRRDRMHNAREAEKTAALEARPKYPEKELAWAAGHFEGEGTVTIVKGGRRGHCRSLVTIASTDLEFVQFFQDRWPSFSIRKRKKEKAHHMQQYVWTAYGQTMLAFLLDVHPYLVSRLRQQKFDLAIACQRARRRGARDPSIYEGIRAMHQEMRTLNHRPSRGDIKAIEIVLSR